jgi:hypothetical protein
LSDKNFTTSEYILAKDNDRVKLLNRFCPHRMYPISQPGDRIEQLVCKFHGFEWTKEGTPVNNNRNIHCGSAEISAGGLVVQNFIEPNHKWVDDISNETDLEYSHTLTGASQGSWLWMMEIQVDLLHIRKGEDVVHPELAKVTDLDLVTMEQGEGWVLQSSPTGWWLFIYPFTFIEWSPGCLAINSVTPNDINNEFGFSWTTQFYYSPSVTEEKRKEMETLEDVFKEDVGAIEMQKGGWFPLKRSSNRLEDHCVHFGEWVLKHRS